MKKTILLTLLTCLLGAGSLFAQFIVKPTFFETTGVSNDGEVVGYEAQAGPYSIWDANNNTFVTIGGAAPGQGIGGSARFSEDGNLISGSDLVELTVPTEWEKLNTGFNYIFKDFEFPGNQSSVGFAGGQSLTYNGDGIVIATYNGGDTWEQLWFEEDKGIEAISFPTTWTGYVGGWNNYFAKTTDGGSTWTPLNPGTDVYLYTGVVFKDELNGVVTAQTNTGVGVYTTSDGGNTWTTGSGLTGVPYKLTHVANDIYFMVTNGGDILKSTDNGLTWNISYTGGGLLLGIEFYDEMNGIATAENDVFKTTDGGATWVSNEVIQGALWRDVAWLDQDHVTLVGTPELIFASEDGGDTWPIDNIATSSLNEALYEVAFMNDGTGFILGSQGVMFRKRPESVTYSMMSMYNVANDEWTELGGFNYPIDDNLSSGYNVSGDGSTFVGSAYVAPTPGHTGVAVHATAWTATEGLIDLGSLYTDINRSTRANDVSHDGSVIVGWQDFNGPWKSAVWRKDANGDYLPNEFLLVDPNGDPTDELNQLGEASAVSGDGNWIAGRGDFANNYEPWIWSETTGYMSLGTLSSGATGNVTDINYDGSIVIGYFQIGPFDPNVPFIWTPSAGLQDFNVFVSETLGYPMGATPVYVPNSMSPNGKFITGWGYDPTIGQWGELFTFRVELPGIPTNDACSEAEALACGDLVINSTVFASDSGGNGSNDVFYSYTGSGEPETITLNACGDETTFLTTVRVFTDCTLTNQIAFNDSSCDNQTEFSFESDGVTTYTIMVEGYSSADAGKFQLQLTCAPVLGVDSFQKNLTTLTPNPVRNILNMSSQIEVDSVQVYNVSGVEVLSLDIQNTAAEIDFSGLSTGVYFVKTIANDTVETFKIIKD